MYSNQLPEFALFSPPKLVNRGCSQHIKNITPSILSFLLDLFITPKFPFFQIFSLKYSVSMFHTFINYLYQTNTPAGTWMNILEVLSRIAILVNAALIAFTFDYLPMIVYQRHHDNNETMAGYVDFMLATHKFTLANGTNQTCR